MKSSIWSCTKEVIDSLFNKKRWFFWAISINIGGRPRFIKLMQNLRQSFLANTDTFELSASYEPSHIRLRLVDHRDGTIKEGLYYDSNLPEEVKK